MYTARYNTDKKPLSRKFSTDLDNGDFDRLERVNLGRPRSGTLPSAFNIKGDPLIGHSDSKSHADLGELDKLTCSRSQPSHLVRARQSVTWLDPTYQTCERDRGLQVSREEGDAECQHASNCPHYIVNADLIRNADRGTLVVLNPVDRLGYAQLLRPQSGQFDRGSPTPSTYPSFPTSFV